MKGFKKKLDQLLFRFSAWLVTFPSIKAHFEKIEEETRKRSENRLKMIGKNTPLVIVKKLFVTAIALTLIILYGLQLTRYMDWPPPEYTDPNVLNLTRAEVEWDVYYGESPKCGNIDCFLTEDWPKEKYRYQEILPSNDFPLRDYQPGSGKPIYYRATIDIPKNIFDPQQALADPESSSTIMIHSLYVWARRYDLYAGEKHISDGGKQELYASIPWSTVRDDGKLFLSMKVDPGDHAYQGLANLGELLIGPKYILDGLKETQIYQQYTYFLFYVIPPAIYGILFCFFFLSFTVNREQFAFALYAFVSFFALSLNLDSFSELLPFLNAANAKFALLNVIKETVFVYLIMTLFRREKLQERILVICLLGGVLFLSLGIFFLNFDVWVSEKLLNSSKISLGIFAGFYGLKCSLETVLFLGFKKSNSNRNMLFLVLGFLFATSILISIATVTNYISMEYRGFVRLNFDLVLFGFIALVTGIDFGGATHQKQKAENTLSKMTGSEAAQSALSLPDISDAEDLSAFVLFTDIRGFTSFSERNSAKNVQKFLNEYFEAMLPIIRQNKGYINNFLGDGLICYWPSQTSQKEAATNALNTCLEMRKKIRDINKSPHNFGETVRVGIALHFGQVSRGTIGDKERYTYTIIGDTVNTTARLESLCKSVKADILISQSVFHQVKDQVVVSEVGGTIVKGKSVEIRPMKLLGLIRSDSRKTLVTYSNKISAFVGDIKEAKIIDEDVDTLNQDLNSDQPSVA